MAGSLGWISMVHIDTAAKGETVGAALQPLGRRSVICPRDNDGQKCNTDGAGEKLISQLPPKYSRNRLTRLGITRDT